jgi:hypothetical protein
MSYAPHVAFWGQRGRALTSELVGGNREKLWGVECARITTRALSLLPACHGPAIFRIDWAYYQLELLEWLRRPFTVSVPRHLPSTDERANRSVADSRAVGAQPDRILL